MAVLRLGHFRAGPADTGDMLTRHAAPAAAVEDAFPGLIEMRPATRGGPVYDGGTHSPACRLRCRRPASRGPGPRSCPPKSTRPDTRRSMRDRVRPVHGKDMADPCGGRHARHWSWPARPSPQPRHGIGRAPAARREGEQA
jgi:hypothetical protein